MKDKLNILICNERLLFRFGVDRLLLILAENLRKQGHRITFLANNFDESVVMRFADEIHRVPEGAESYIQLDTFTSSWVDKAWDELFWKAKPDLAIIGGWPFFSTIPVLEKHGTSTLFIDCGSVPVDGFTGPALEIQLYLKQLRKTHLPKLSAISPISNFVSSTQSRADAPSVRSQVILLGADHMAESLWNSEAVVGASATLPVKRSADANELRIINLGRWEPGCYKNSESVFEISSALSRRKIPHKIYVLADPAKFTCPQSVSSCIEPIGFPDDAHLQDMMDTCDVGISVSLWEGFNLPLAEMQWLNKPVLTFDCAAHPEVVVNKWYLCRDVGEMAKKLENLHQSPRQITDQHRADRSRHHDFFRWSRVIREYTKFIDDIVVPKMAVFVDVSNATRDPANSGVIRVTRRLCQEMQEFFDPIFLVWIPESGQYAFPTEAEYRQLAQFNGPAISDSLPRSSGSQRILLAQRPEFIKAGSSWLLLTETIFEKNGAVIRRFCKNAGIRTAAIFYDAIPVLRPDYVKDVAIRENHADYMRGLAECDVVIPISEFSANCLNSFWQKEAKRQPPIVTNALPGEFGGAKRTTSTERSLRQKVARILCVSTLEPRKGHRKLLKALRLLDKEHPNFDWEITFIGNRYAGAQDIADEMVAFCKDEPRAQWLGIVDDAALHQAYSSCTHTIYASEIEGFGMPIMESLWHGKPCICHDSGVMAELAQEGGCLTTDMNSPEAIAGAIYQLGTAPGLLDRLTSEASSRPIKTWHDYTGDFIRILREMSANSQHEVADNSSFTALANTVASTLAALEQTDGLSIASRTLLNALEKHPEDICNIILSDKTIAATIGQDNPRQTFFLLSPAAHDQVVNSLENVVSIQGDAHFALDEVLEELDVRGPLPTTVMIISSDEKFIDDGIRAICAYTPKQSLVVYVETDNPELAMRRPNLLAKSGLLDRKDKSKVSSPRFIEHLEGRYVLCQVVEAS